MIDYYLLIECSDEYLKETLESWGTIPCCTHRWTDKMGHNLKAIMKVMRFAVRRGKTIFNLHSLISNQTVTSKLLKYPFDNDKKYLAYKQRPQQYDTTSMIPWCTLNNGSNVKSWHEYSRDEVKPCSFFQPVITNNGICLVSVLCNMCLT